MDIYLNGCGSEHSMLLSESLEFSLGVEKAPLLRRFSVYQVAQQDASVSLWRVFYWLLKDYADKSEALTTRLRVDWIC